MLHFSYHLLILFYLSFPHSSLAIDVLHKGENLKDGETLFSSSKRFEFGFFTPDNSTSRYIGIWHHNISTQTVVWVLNRDKPLEPNHAILTFQTNGNLALVNHRNNNILYWSTNISSTIIQIRNTGELVLLTANDTVLWNSFDLPTDAFLPGMSNEHTLGAKCNTRSKIAIICPSAAAFIFIFACILLLWKFRFTVLGCFKEGKCGSTIRSRKLFSSGQTDFSGNEEKDSDLPWFNLDTIINATNNFSLSNKLGEGGFGGVFKGTLHGGIEVAVKKLSLNSRQGHQEFKNEMTLIAKLQHRNLVRLVGCCVHENEKMLIYEYMPNKSLDSFIFNPAKQHLLDWNSRFSIIEGIAHGLVYLHRDSRFRIVHRDLKASNILLDVDMNPKISDFGMARIFETDQNELNTRRVVGTFGYMPPEYAMEGFFSFKSDAYSFGILLLELVSGRRNNSFHHMPNTINIAGYAWKLWDKQRAVEMIDPSIRESCSIPQVVRCIQIGLLCVQDRADDRPNMHSVVLMLANDNSTLAIPSAPLFTLKKGPVQTPFFNDREEACSVNNVTITEILAR